MIRLMVMNGLLICLVFIWTTSASEPAKELRLEPQAEILTQPNDEPQISSENSEVYEFGPSISAAEKVMLRRKIHTISHARSKEGIEKDSSPPLPASKSGGQRLLFSAGKLSWVDAQKDCKARGGALASLGDEPQDVFDFISDNLGRKSFWLGGSDIKTEGNWLWLNGNSIDLTKNWRRNEPNNGGRSEDCMWLYRGNYYDRSCSREYQYICDLDSADNIPYYERIQHLFFSEDRMYWEDAKEDCEAKQGTLAVLENEPVEVFAHIDAHYAGIALWLGGSDIAEEGDWKWLNGNPIDLTKYWRRNEPNNWWGGEDCLEYYYGYNDRSCRRRNRYICNLAPITTTPAPTTLPSNTTSTEDHCTDNMYQCSSGKCIFQPWLCDGENDCLDGADELDCLNNTCSANQYQCTSRQCIYQTWLCDGENDCSDGADEQDCQKNTCSVNQYQCSSGQCIYQTWLCDGENDCSDGADEQDCQTNTCFVDQYQCSSGQCINHTLVCDTLKDCTDGSDEQDCQDNTCILDQYQCSSGQCIIKSWLCDGINDCNNGEDEQNCQNNICTVGQFQCLGGQCIDQAWLCDGLYDCPDGTDEQNCQNYTCSVYKFRCQSGQCIDQTWLCDDEIDCADGEDEQDCTEELSMGLSCELKETQNKTSSIRTNKKTKTNAGKKKAPGDKNADAKKNNECNLQWKNVNGGFKGHAPLILDPKKNINYKEMVTPSDTKQYMTFLCSGTKFKTYDTDKLTFKCVDRKIKLSNGKKMENIEDFGCTKRVMASIYPVRNNAKPPVQESCGNNGKKYVIGFGVNEKCWVELIDVCFDENAATTKWTQHTYDGPLMKISHVTGTSRPGFETDGFGNLPISHFYTRSAQYQIFKLALALEGVLCSGGNFEIYLVIGHLSAMSDFVSSAEQQATFFHMNALPMWQSINNGNWRIIENGIQNYAKSQNKKVNITTGGYGTLIMENGIWKKEIYFGNYFYNDDGQLAIKSNIGQQGQIPVPAVIWKAVKLLDVVFVVINNPFPNTWTKLDKLKQLCGGNDCAKLEWLRPASKTKEELSKLLKDHVRGMTFCCNISQFKQLYCPSGGDCPPI